MRTLFSAFLGVWFLCMACGARAQETADYREAIKQGTGEFQSGNYAEARSQFSRAHKLFPNARTSRALGMAEFELKNYGESIEHLQRALASDARPLDAAQRKETEQLLDRARGYVARLSVSVEPEAATVLMDGVPVKLEAGRTLVVQVGDHVLEFRAPGRLSEKRLVKVEGGEERELRVVLPAPEAQPAPQVVLSTPDKRSAPPAKPKRLYQKPWLWVVVGVVVAGAAAGTAIALTRDKGGSRPDNGGPTLVAP